MYKATKMKDHAKIILFKHVNEIIEHCRRSKSKKFDLVDQPTESVGRVNTVIKSAN